jgi:hypothetical protein
MDDKLLNSIKEVLIKAYDDLTAGYNVLVLVKAHHDLGEVSSTMAELVAPLNPTAVTKFGIRFGESTWINIRYVTPVPSGAAPHLANALNQSSTKRYLVLWLPRKQ